MAPSLEETALERILPNLGGMGRAADPPIGPGLLIERAGVYRRTQEGSRQSGSHVRVATDN